MSDVLVGLGAGLALLCALSLPIVIWRLVALVRAGVVATVELIPEQEIDFESAGRYLLHAQGPRSTRAFARLDYTLSRARDERTVDLTRTRLPLSTSGVSRSRLSLRRFSIETPGTYRLRVSGLDDPSPADDHNLVFTSDDRTRVIGLILCVVAAGIGLIAGSAISLLALLWNP